MQFDLPLWKDPESDAHQPHPPGYFIKLELERRGWGQADLAAVTQRPLPTINEIINAKRAITPEMAVALGRAFSQAPGLWAHREAAYRLSIVNSSDSDTEKKAKLFELAPIKELQRRGWIDPSAQTADELESELTKFMGAPALEESPQITALARQSFPAADFSSTQRAWLFQAAKVANLVNVRPYSDKALEAAFLKLKKLTMKPEHAAYVPQVLAEAGVRFVIVEDLPKTKIDGAAFYLNGERNKPVIVLSMRIDRMESFWHTLGHEMRHIANDDPTSLDSDLVGEDKSKMVNSIEQKADHEAAAWLVPPDQMESFILRSKPYYTQERLIQFSKRMGVHPSIVVGQLQHKGLLGWDKFYDLRPKVKEHIIETAMTDGYGKKPQ